MTTDSIQAAVVAAYVCSLDNVVSIFLVDSVTFTGCPTFKGPQDAIYRLRPDRAFLTAT